jgi:hypothetical protein
MMTAFPGSTNKTTVLLDAGNYPSYSSYLNMTYTFPVAAQTPNWALVNSGTIASNIDSAGPLPARIDAIMCYDGTDVMLWGGRTSSSTGGALTNQWHWGGSAWVKAAPTAVPSGRYKAECAYLSGTGVVLFGGALQDGQLLDEVWTWTNAGNTWTQTTSTNLAATWPCARIGHGMAADASKVVLFGGKGYNSSYNDTWTFASGTWTLCSPTTPPSVRSEFCMASDGTHFVIFGGKGEYDTYPETWVLNNACTAWTQISPAGGVTPSARVGAQFSYDSTLSKFVLMGGIDSTTNYPALDTWSFTTNGSTGTWAQL